MQIVFRVDSSAQIGTGHMARCLTLANALRENGKSTCFISRWVTPGMERQLAAQGHVLLRLPPGREADARLAHAHWLGASQHEDARSTAAAIPGGECEWLVVDHYGLDAEWEEQLRSHARNILVIDDLADRRHVCNVLLDQNLQAKGSDRYTGLVGSDCKQLVGPRYALLRPEFRAARRIPSGTVSRLNIFFGGVDPDGVTLKALDAVEKSGLSLQVDVVAGVDNPHLDAIRMRCAQMGAMLHVQSGEMARLFASADLGLGAGGATSWERCCAGLPAIIVSIADNQRAGCRALQDAGAAFYLGDADLTGVDMLADAVIRALSNPAELVSTSRRAVALVDGRGTERVALVMSRKMTTVRPARLDDADITWAWRNHPDTRRHFHDPSPVPREAHLSWWSETLGRNDRVLLVARCGDIDIGVLRFDCKGDEALVSVYLDPDLTGLGLGAGILQAGRAWMAANKPEIVKLNAEILPQNTPSARTFTAAGYLLQGDIHWTRSVH